MERLPGIVLFTIVYKADYRQCLGCQHRVRQSPALGVPFWIELNNYCCKGSHELTEERLKDILGRLLDNSLCSTCEDRTGTRYLCEPKIVMWAHAILAAARAEISVPRRRVAASAEPRARHRYNTRSAARRQRNHQEARSGNDVIDLTGGDTSYDTSDIGREAIAPIICASTDQASNAADGPVHVTRNLANNLVNSRTSRTTGSIVERRGTASILINGLNSHATHTVIDLTSDDDENESRIWGPMPPTSNLVTVRQESTQSQATTTPARSPVVLGALSSLLSIAAKSGSCAICLEDVSTALPDFEAASCAICLNPLHTSCFSGLCDSSDRNSSRDVVAAAPSSARLLVSVKCPSCRTVLVERARSYFGMLSWSAELIAIEVEAREFARRNVEMARTDTL